MYEIGQWVFDSLSGNKVRLLEKEDLWGYVSYKVYDPVYKNIYQVDAKHVSATSESISSEAFVRYISLLSKIRNKLSGGILSQLGESILPLPHQIYALNKALSNNNVRYLLADEVGLGKTIEAGLIIKELKTRGLIKRILVVCPKGLVTQWHIEMKEKFNETFNIILPEDYDTIRRLNDNMNVYEDFNQVISPMDSIKPLEKRAGWSKEKIDKYNNDRIYSIVNGGWDLIIIDEAHRVAGSSSEVARYKMGKLLAKSSPYLLLLTATPHSGKTEPFLRLVRLLDEEAFPDYRAIVKEQVAPYIIRTEKRDAVDHEGNKLFKNRITRVIEIKWEERHSLQKKLYEMVTNYVSYGYNKALKTKKPYIGFLMVLMQRLVSSSTSAIRDSIERRIEILENQASHIPDLSIEDFAEVEAEVSLEELLTSVTFDFKKELDELKNILVVAKQAEYQYLDAKAEHLLDLLDKLFNEDKNRKVIIFTEFVTTQSFLRDFLNSRNYSTSILNGSMSIEERNFVLKEFKTKTDILISTDAGGEGLNLQFSNVVINYDLPWNPMKIEQRIGRVDRIGQKNDVLVFNYVLEGTVEKRVREVLESKLSVIFEQMGIDKMQDVLDNELAEIDFTDVYIKSITDPKFEDYYIDKMESDIKEQVNQAKKIRELITEDKAIDLEVLSTVGEFNTNQLLQQMYINYKSYRNEAIENIEQLFVDFGNEEVNQIISQELKWEKTEGAVIINLPDLPNEKGYWSLWELSLGNATDEKIVLPLFINLAGRNRPASAKRIWDELCKPNRKIDILGVKHFVEDEYEKIYSSAKEIAYDNFLELKKRYEEKIEQKYRKYNYALDLRIEAAERIGIENIKRSRLKKLNQERVEMQKKFNMKKQICPEFKPIFFALME